MPSPRAVLRALLPFALHAAAREVDRAVGVLLHTTLDLPGFVPAALALVDPGRLAGAVALWVGGGALLWALLAAAGRDQRGLGAALDEESRAFLPLLLRPAITIVALVALAVHPIYPYGFTLAVALTQDWAPAQDVLALAFVVAAHRDLIGRVLLRIPAPDALSLGLMAFVVYALLSPGWSRHWDGHPGNEPKTLRMALAIGHRLSLDVEPVNAPMEELPVQPASRAAAESLGALARHSAEMAGAVVRGEAGRDAIRATRVTRQTIRGKEGGIFHVLAPGTSLLLAPALRVDRAVNRVRGTPGRLAVTLLLWNALAAWLVVAVFQLARDASGRRGLSAALAAFTALAPPYLFYFYQFYPEMLGALGMTLAVRRALFGPRWTFRTALAQSLLLALLPWLHQKFLPVWGVLCVMAFVRAVADLVTLRALIALVLPQVLTLYLTALYNFAIAGSVRPDALFLAWGPGGVSSSRIGQGLLGLWFDARYGLLPYAPVFALGVAGLARGGAGVRRLRWAAPAMLAYYLTVASADNWSGAVCNLGRYIMPVTPWLVALAACGLGAARAGGVAIALALAGWTALLAMPLWHDPHAANDCALLLAKSTFADGNQYLPNLFLRTWNDAAPGTLVRVAAALGLVGALGLAMRHGGPRRLASSLAIGAAAALGLALVLESWPSDRNLARYSSPIELQPGTTAFASEGRVQAGTVLVHGNLDVLVRSRTPLREVVATVAGEGVARPAGAPPVALSLRGTALAASLETLAHLRGRQGVEEWLYRLRLELEPRGTAQVLLTLR